MNDQPMSLAQALEVCDQVSPMPQVAHEALQVLRAELDAMLKVVNFGHPMAPREGGVARTVMRDPNRPVMLGIRPQDKKVVITAVATDENWLEALKWGLIAVRVTPENARRYFGEEVPDIYGIAVDGHD